jgi:hypothetical protein
VLVEHGPHCEVEIAVPDRKVQKHLGPHDLFSDGRRASRTVSLIPSVAANQGDFQNGIPTMSCTPARMPASAVLFA